MNTEYKNIKIIYEDNHLLVVVKPQNLPTQADVSGDPDLLSILKEYLKVTYNKAGEAYLGMVQRLDRPTGGVMVFAKTSKAAARLCESIKSGDVEKKYLAVVYDVPKEKKQHLTNYLMKNSVNNTVMVVPELTDGAKRADLDYTVLSTEPSGRLSLLLIKLDTGRSHQIRVQLSNLGNPIVGDRKYSGTRPKADCELALWAVELRLKHPVTGTNLVFRVYPPEDEKPWKFFNLETFLKQNRG